MNVSREHPLACIRTWGRRIATNKLMTNQTCQHCEMPIEGTEPAFCCHCGALLPSLTTPDQPVEESDGDYWDVGTSQDVEDIAKIAIPDNFKEVPLEHLRRRVVQAIWIRAHCIDPYATFGVSWINPDQDSRNKTLDSNNSGFGGWTAPSMPALPIQPYHLVWSRGLISHVNLTGEESERIRSILESVGYQVEHCDCDKVRYSPSHTSPGFLCKS